MNTITKSFSAMWRIALASTALIAISATAAPSNTTCIAPAGAGGGWDFTCRVPAAQLMPKLGVVEGDMEVVNMSGAGGGKAYAYVVAEKSDDENLIVAASMATAARLGQNVYSGFSADDVRWVGALGADYGVLAVRQDSPLESLDDLIAKLKDVKIVGASAAGGWDHLKPLILADKAGIKDLGKISYIAFDNGGKALLEVIGGRADVFTGDTSEVLDYLHDDNKKDGIRILTVFSPERIPRIPDVPTAREQGHDVIGANWRGFYAPKNMSDEQYEAWVTAVETVASSDEWQDLRAKNGLAPFESFGDDFESFVAEQIDSVARISRDLGFMK